MCFIFKKVIPALLLATFGALWAVPAQAEDWPFRCTLTDDPEFRHFIIYSDSRSATGHTLVFHHKLGIRGEMDVTMTETEGHYVVSGRALSPFIVWTRHFLARIAKSEGATDAEAQFEVTFPGFRPQFNDKPGKAICTRRARSSK